MAGKPRLVAPIVTVIMDDGSVFEDVQTTNYDMLKWERYARTHNLPSAQDAPMEFATWIAWHATKREGLTADLSYDDFAERALSVEPKAAVVDPTDAAPADG